MEWIFLIKRGEIDAMYDYCSRIVGLCEELCSTWDDFSDKQKVVANNKAMDKLWKLHEKMNNDEGKDVLLNLLAHENDKVALIAGMLCLKLHFNVKETLERVDDIKENSKESLYRFQAKMMLYNNRR